MLYLFWELLSIACLLLLLVAAYKAARHIKEQYGLFVALLFVMGCFAVGNRNGSDATRNNSTTVHFVHPDSLQTYADVSHKVILEASPVASYELYIAYATNRDNGIHVPLKAFSYTTGFESGIAWRPVDIMVHTSADNKAFQYQVTGAMEWRLLGFTMFSQYKRYAGMTSIE